jgi:hypothetical protein
MDNRLPVLWESAETAGEIIMEAVELAAAIMEVIAFLFSVFCFFFFMTIKNFLFLFFLK